MKKPFARMTALISILLAATLVSGCATASEWPSAVTVKTAKAVKSSLSAPLNCAGVLIPAQTENIYSKLSGTIADIKADVSSNVSAGETLIVIDTREMSAQRDQANAGAKTASAAASTVKGQARIAKVAYDDLQQAYDVMLPLVKAGLASASDLGELKIKLDTAKAQYEVASNQAVQQAYAAANAARAAVNTIDAQLANSTITSPISGVVITRNVNPGEIAAAGVPLMTVADVSSLKLKCIIPQALLPFITSGQAVDVWADVQPDKTFQGTVTRIYPATVSTGEYFPIDITFSNDGTLKPGLSGHATLTLAAQSAVTVPSSAVVMLNGNTYVYIVKDNKAERCKVSVGFSDGKTDVITQGLEEGAVVVTENASSLFDGVPVSASGQ
jgi:HlyD family secretion protein